MMDTSDRWLLALACVIAAGVCVKWGLDDIAAGAVAWGAVGIASAVGWLLMAVRAARGCRD